MRRVLRRAAIVFASLAAATVVAEVAVRALGLAPPVPRQYTRFVPDPVLPFRLEPNSVVEGRSGSDEFDFRYEHNAHGFRDRERERTKPEGVFRILGLGDSFTYGAGVEANETYLARLERALAERAGDHPPVEVVRAGVPRYFTKPERLLLQHDGPAWDPDLVIVGFVPNDVIDAAVGMDGLHVDESGRLLSGEFARLVERFGAAPLVLYERSHLARLFLRAWTRRADRGSAARVDPAEIYSDVGALALVWLRVEEELGRIADIARAQGAALVVVHLPQKGPWTPERGYPATRLAAWAEREGVAFVDTLPALRESAEIDSAYWPIDGHPRAAAHAVFARVLFDELERRGLVP